jgi:hypothetical protein
MLVTGLVAYPTLNVWPLCILVGTPCIFNLFIHGFPCFLLVMIFLALMLGSNLRSGYSLLKLLHHISMIILRRLHLSLFLQLVQFRLKSLDFNLQVSILLSYNFITRFYKHLLLLRRLALIKKSIKINVIASFISFAC